MGKIKDFLIQALDNGESPAYAMFKLKQQIQQAQGAQQNQRVKNEKETQKNPKTKPCSKGLDFKSFVQTQERDRQKKT